VPGVVATQHSGDGKATQYFLRGFNLDHGTDFAIRVDGMPVNMVAHGHGQGYADLNFLIPELVWDVRYRKGPYFADISAYAIDYRFDLFSDFTYGLDDPVHGDQIEQTDRRRVYGAEVSHTRANQLGGFDGLLSFGAQWRGDRIGEVGLYGTPFRTRRSTLRDDQVSQDLVSIYGQQLVNFTDRWRGYVGLRGDFLAYDVRGRESAFGAANSGSGHDSLMSPKAGLAYTLTPAHEFYLNAGRGFHSNDVRGATITVDPRTTEPGRASKRHGVEATLRWTPGPHWRVEADAAWSRARFKGTPPAGEGNNIDNAIETALAAGLVWTDGPTTATLRLRYMGPRALDTTNTVRSHSTTMLNFGVRHAVHRHLTLGLDIFNLAGSKGNDIESRLTQIGFLRSVCVMDAKLVHPHLRKSYEYYYASCTAAEIVSGVCGGGIDDRHVHPIEPRTVRVSARWTF
jgi:outer membrane receptor protein involved in Fe transport